MEVGDSGSQAQRRYVEIRVIGKDRIKCFSHDFKKSMLKFKSCPIQ